MGEWLGCSLAVLGEDGLSLLTSLQRCDGLNSPLFLTIWFHLLGWIKIGHLPHSGQG